jgi:hypothetical protein
MKKIRNGTYQFIYNIGNGDIRVFDIYSDGQIRETIARTNEINFVTTDRAMAKLDEMLDIAEAECELYAKTPLINKTTRTKYEHLFIIRKFLEEHYITKDEVRWF